MAAAEDADVAWVAADGGMTADVAWMTAAEEATADVTWMTVAAEMTADAAAGTIAVGTGERKESCPATGENPRDGMTAGARSIIMSMTTAAVRQMPGKAEKAARFPA